jgi:hypothetical protein
LADQWGELKSSGCVNLSPSTRSGLQNGPAAPKDWQGARSVPEPSSDAVVVSDIAHRSLVVVFTERHRDLEVDSIERLGSNAWCDPRSNFDEAITVDRQRLFERIHQ